MIFVDMDGVVADFDGHYERLFGVRPTRWPDAENVNWKLVHSIPDFYRTMPLMHGAYDLVRFVDEIGGGCAFLTGVPATGRRAAAQKTEWVAEHFDGFRCICCPAKDKREHGAPGDILIDDYLRYRQAWVDMGGIFVHHTGVRATIRKLRELGKCATPEESC